MYQNPVGESSILLPSRGIALVPGAPVAAGPKYGLDRAAQASAQRPVVLVPEDVVPSSSSFWAVGAAGSLGSPARLGSMVNDCLQKLNALQSPAGTPYLEPRDPGSIRRFFLAGHSGGGVPLAPSCTSTLALSVPTDLWLYDCTYGAVRNPSYVRFCRHWRSNGQLGNDARSSRMAIFVTSDPLTTGVAANLIRELRQPFAVNGRRFPGFTYARLTRRGLTPSAPSVDIVEALPDATVAQIDTALRTSPVVFVHTVEPHDHIPLVWTPRLLSSAATP